MAEILDRSERPSTDHDFWISRMSEFSFSALAGSVFPPGVWECPHEAVSGPVLEDGTSHQRGLLPQVLDFLSRYQGSGR